MFLLPEVPLILLSASLIVLRIFIASTLKYYSNGQYTRVIRWAFREISTALISRNVSKRAVNIFLQIIIFFFRIFL